MITPRERWLLDTMFGSWAYVDILVLPSAPNCSTESLSFGS